MSKKKDKKAKTWRQEPLAPAPRLAPAAPPLIPDRVPMSLRLELYGKKGKRLDGLTLRRLDNRVAEWDFSGTRADVHGLRIIIEAFGETFTRDRPGERVETVGPFDTLTVAGPFFG